MRGNRHLTWSSEKKERFLPCFVSSSSCGLLSSDKITFLILPLLHYHLIENHYRRHQQRHQHIIERHIIRPSSGFLLLHQILASLNNQQEKISKNG